MPRFRHGAAEAHAIEPHADTAKKLGKVATTSTSTEHSCPTCPLWDACFFRQGLHTGRLDHELRRASEGATPIEVAHAEANGIDELRGNVPLRIHVGGDCRTAAAAQVVAAAARRYMDRFGQPVWTFTHGWREPYLVRRSDWGWVSALASCEKLEELDEALGLGFAPALTVQRHPANGKAWRWGRWKIVPCPEQTQKAESCATCRLCFGDAALRNRRVAISFSLHGPPKAIKAAPKLEVPPGAKIVDVPNKRRTFPRFERAPLDSETKGVRVDPDAEPEPEYVPEEMAPLPGRRRRNTCSRCGRKGHNSRSKDCPGRSDTDEPDMMLGKRCVDCQGAIDHDGSEIVCLKCLVDAISQNPTKGGAGWAFKVLLRATERPDLRVKAIGLARQHFRGRWRGYLDGSDKVKRAMVKTKPPPKPRVIPQIPREPKPEPEPEPAASVAEPTHERGTTMATTQRKCAKCGEEYPGSGRQTHCDECILRAIEGGDRQNTWVRRLEQVARRSPNMRRRCLDVVVKAAETGARVKIPDSLRPTSPPPVRTFDDIDKVAKKHTRKKATRKPRKNAKKKPARKTVTRRIVGGHATKLADAVATDVTANEFDEELAAMATVHKALEPLMNASRERVVRYVFDRLDFSL